MYTKWTLFTILLITACITQAPARGQGLSGTAEVPGETLTQGVSPGIRITGTNAGQVGRYEKFEVWYDLERVEIENPYDPEDIDVYALFTAPSGREIRINGF